MHGNAGKLKFPSKKMRNTKGKHVPCGPKLSFFGHKVSSMHTFWLEAIEKYLADLPSFFCLAK